MKPSDIRIVGYCLDYMQLLDSQGDINKELDSNVGIHIHNHTQRIMNPYTDSLYSQTILQEKRERYTDFIRKVLHMYQLHKNVFTPYAPDVHFENIKQSKDQIVCFECVVVPTPDETPTTSPFAEDSSKLSSIVSQLPSVHHNRSKRQRRMVEDTTLPMIPVVNDIFPESQYLQTSSLMMPIQQLQGIPVNQQMIQLQQLPISMTPVLTTNQPVGQPSQVVQSVDPMSLEQPQVDPHPVQHPVVIQEAMKQDGKQESDGKNVTFHLCQPNEEQPDDHVPEMDVKRVFVQ